MKTALLRVALLTALLLAIGSDGHAQTVTNGPYYAVPSWDQTFACATAANCPRFLVLSNLASAAVLDRETGLVWERAPSTASFTWSDASNHCRGLVIGDRMGWRLPAIEEVLTLVDPNGGFLELPPGHPFTPLGLAWSSTLITPTRGLGFDFHQPPFGGIGAFDLGGSLPDFLPVWCVRGGKQGAISTP